MDLVLNNLKSLICYKPKQPTRFERYRIPISLVLPQRQCHPDSISSLPPSLGLYLLQAVAFTIEHKAQVFYGGVGRSVVFSTTLLILTNHTY